MSKPEFYKDRSSREIFPRQETENHPLKNSLLSKLDILTWGIIITPGYVGTGVLGLGGGLDENIRNISIGLIAWTGLGVVLIHFTPKIAAKGYSMLTESSIFHRFLDKVGIAEEIDKFAQH
ncbi:hypothetical protein A3B39_00315 [Candidatus Daviesbacteria bacterium RIFCSPLOWO2_01_FULL_37_10]|nr:MAG: hypothetical protein A2111_03295 [Candidatus Daviesbacteria bacterium GWA1_38_6]OGE44839.1 MAG: hypothetical protein A3B39_00315 [Candidatus Daviesbacteria bacterium RIFCSPLOWO2_01_FULL_37_10]